MKFVMENWNNYLNEINFENLAQQAKSKAKEIIDKSGTGLKNGVEGVLREIEETKEARKIFVKIVNAYRGKGKWSDIDAREIEFLSRQIQDTFIGAFLLAVAIPPGTMPFILAFIALAETLGFDFLPSSFKEPKPDGTEQNWSPVPKKIRYNPSPPNPSFSVPTRFYKK